MQAQLLLQLGIAEERHVIESGAEGQLEDAVVSAVALDEAGPFAELFEAGLEVRLEAEEGGIEGVDSRVGEWWGSE